MQSGPWTRFFATLLAGLMGFCLHDEMIKTDPDSLKLGCFAILLIIFAIGNAFNRKETWEKLGR